MVSHSLVCLFVRSSFHSFIHSFIHSFFSHPSEDKDKLKKQDFALMVVEKIGDQTNQVIVAQGENKTQKIAEASNKIQKHFESISSESSL